VEVWTPLRHPVAEGGKGGEFSDDQARVRIPGNQGGSVIPARTNGGDGLKKQTAAASMASFASVALEDRDDPGAERDGPGRFRLWVVRRFFTQISATSRHDQREDQAKSPPAVPSVVHLIKTILFSSLNPLPPVIR